MGQGGFACGNVRGEGRCPDLLLHGPQIQLFHGVPIPRMNGVRGGGLPRACQRLWVFWGDISQDLPILDRRKERLERLEHKHHVVLSFTPVGRFGFWAPQIFVREDRCPSLSVPCPAHVRLSLQAPGRVEVAGRCADQRRWRCLPSSNHPVPQINPTAHALIVLHKDSVKQCGCHWSRRR